MTQEEELENKIRDYITNVYKATYNRRLEVKNTDGIYTLTLGVPDDLIPTSISFSNRRFSSISRLCLWRIKN